MDPLLMGVSLDYMANLPIPSDATFDEVCRFVLSLTSNDDPTKHRSLAMHLFHNPETHMHVRPMANVFVSYAWSGTFGSTMRALQEMHHTKENPPFLWMDVAIVDQWKAKETNIDFQEWCHVFSNTLKQIQRAVIVLSPGDKPVAVTRAWCVYEWITVVECCIPHEFLVDPNDKAVLRQKMKTGKMDVLQFLDIISAIDVESAKAFKDSDRSQILTKLRDVGVLKVNNVVLESVKTWLVGLAQEALNDKDVTPCESIFVHNAFAALYQSVGDLDNAQVYFLRAVDMARTLQDEYLLWGSLDGLHEVFAHQGNFSDAETAGQEALTLSLKMWGENDSKTAQSMNNLAKVFTKQGKYAKAEPMLVQSLEIWRQVFGNQHSDVANGLFNLGVCVERQGDYPRAESLMREAIDMWKSTLGEPHQWIATGLASLSLVLKNQNQLSEAELICRQALYMREKTDGKHSAHYAQVLKILGEILSADSSRDEECEACFQECLTIYQAIQAGYAFVATVANSFGMFYRSRGRISQAEALYRKAIALLLESGQPETSSFMASTLHNLALLLQDKAEWKESDEILLKVCAIWRALHAKRNLAFALKDRGKALIQLDLKEEEAKGCFQEALDLLDSEGNASSSLRDELATLLSSLAKS